MMNSNVQIYQIENHDSMYFDDFDYAKEKLQEYLEDNENISDETYYLIPSIKADELPFEVGGFTLKECDMSKLEFDDLEKEDVLR